MNGGRAGSGEGTFRGQVITREMALTDGKREETRASERLDGQCVSCFFRIASRAFFTRIAWYWLQRFPQIGQGPMPHFP